MSTDTKHLDPLRKAIHDFVGDDPLPGTIYVDLPNGVEMVVVRESAYRAFSNAFQKLEEMKRGQAEGLTDEITPEDEDHLAALIKDAEDGKN